MKIKKILTIILLVGILTPHANGQEISNALAFSTHYGGSQDEIATSLAVDPQGNIYVTGATPSNDFPTKNAYSSTLGGTYDAYIVSYTPDGNVRWATYLGGGGIEIGVSITTDHEGNVYLLGSTTSVDFPTKNAYNSTLGEGGDLFIASFSSEGSLRWATYLGGNDFDEPVKIATDGTNTLYVIGNTRSTNFPIHQTNTSYNQNGDGIISSFSLDGTIRWSAYIGGSQLDLNLGLTVSSSGAIVSGATFSSDFATTNAGRYDAFLVSFDHEGNQRWVTVIGGNKDDFFNDVTVDESGQIFATGHSNSQDFPMSPINTSSQNILVSSFAEDGSHLWTKQFGGNGVDKGQALGIDASQNLFVMGITNSTDFPTKDAYQDETMGKQDISLMAISKQGDLLWSTYFGGTGDEVAASMTIGNSNNIYLSVNSESIDLPIKEGQGKGESGDAYMAEILNPFEDYDHDEMPNLYEYKNGLNPLVDDADGDIDGDGIRNIDEYRKAIGLTSSTTQNTPFSLSMMILVLVLFRKIRFASRAHNK